MARDKADGLSNDTLMVAFNTLFNDQVRRKARMLDRPDIATRTMWRHTQEAIVDMRREIERRGMKLGAMVAMDRGVLDLENTQ
jgi:hypothetical protein